MKHGALTNNNNVNEVYIQLVSSSQQWNHRELL